MSRVIKQKKTILIVFGTRPEAIKMAPLVNELRNRKSFLVRVCVTGQHRQMLDQALAAFNIIPDYDFSIMRERQDLFDITRMVLRCLKKLLIELAPDLVLVHGDTSTTFVTALSCFYLKIPVGHVEAGLRTKDIYSPFPEEFNRQAAGLIAAMHFAPTETAKANLLAEGKDESTIFVTGNTVIDALKTTIRKDYHDPLLDWAKDSRLILITAHRRENLGRPMSSMFRAIRRIIETFPNVKAIYPIHLNPEIRQTALQYFGDCQKIRITEPLDVVSFHNFMKKSFLIFTDSGGIQEEASCLGKPVLVLRDTTERPEGLTLGNLKLVGTSEEKIFNVCKELMTDKTAYDKMSHATDSFGDGQASKRIADIMEWFLSKKKGNYVEK
ncbi:MAG: non-hydrolyzing UDP-N-acetylglucosamine 2-epimerase [Christensenellales bacterium]